MNILQLPPQPPGERIGYGDDALQFAELRLPNGDGPHPVVIVVHGGFWRAAYNLDHISHVCVALNKEGMATWSLEYRRLGNPGGGWPGTFDDIVSGADHLASVATEHNLDLKRVIALGHSAGGHLVLWLAKRAAWLRGVIPLAAVADLRRAYELQLSNTVVGELLGGSPDSVADRYAKASPIDLVPLRIPQRLIHGTDDTVVPIEISRSYVDVAKACGDDAELISLEGAGHFELIDPATTEFTVVTRAVSDLLR